jgi:pimeloyl-ACP methyl ester carboxylesterase
MKLHPIVFSLMVAGAAVAGAQTVELPKPWGPHAVGYSRVDLTDSSRRETRGAGAGNHRRVVVQIWYPARGNARLTVPYMDSATAAAWSASQRLPAGFVRHVVTHAQRDLPLTDSVGALPVLLFSHGRSWPVQTYQAMLQDLASRGWMVVGMSHPNDEAATTFADGTVAPFDPERWENETERGVVLTRSVNVLVGDAEFVLETLARWNAQRGHRFFGRINREQIGYFGHSLGGAAAVQALHRLPALRAAATIEGSVYDTTARPFRVAKPVLSMIGGYNRAELGLRDYLPTSGGVLFEAIVHGAWHASFADLLLVYGAFAPRAWHTDHRRELAPARVNQITTDYLDAFFGRYLLGRESLLLRPYSDPELGSYRTSGYPEVELRVVAG